MRRILIVDDDADTREIASRALTSKGYGVYEASDGETALELLDGRAVDLMVLDVTMPGMGGLDVLSKVRANGDLPVILLTGHGSEVDRVLGLELGADDYVVKPFSPRELEARIRTVLRRSGQQSPDEPVSETLDFGDLVLDTGSREVFLDGELVETTAREFDLLAFLAASPRRAVSREQLLRRVWRSSAEWQDPGTVTEHIRRLRQKVERDPARPARIVTVRGVGYRFEP